MNVGRPTGTLLFVLRNMREQLRTILEVAFEKSHEEWFEPPLSLFRGRVDEDDVEADVSDDDSEKSEPMEEDQ